MYEGKSGPLVIPAGKETVLDLNGHTIDRKQESSIANGNVITVESGGKLTLEDKTGKGKITGGNNGSNGGGVIARGTFVMNGGTIDGNGAGNSGVLVDDGTFTLNGGFIGGYDGVFNGGTFTMTGGTVNGTTDGVYLNLDSTFNLSGGTINGGNGVNYVGGLFNLSGNPTISATGHSVFLFSNLLINITGALSNTTPISVELMYDTGVFTSGYSEHNSGDPSKRFTSDKHAVSLTADGREAQLGYSVTCGRAQHGAVGADKSMADAGDTVTLSVLPDENYELDTLTVTSGTTSIEVKDNTFKMPAGNVAVAATFKPAQHAAANQLKATMPIAKDATIPIVKMTAKGKTGLTVSWKKVKGATGYDVFFAQCSHDGKETAVEHVKTVKSGKALAWSKSGLQPGTAYKARVKAYVVKNGKKRYIGTSPLMHLYTEGGKYTNAKAVKLNKKKVTIKKGKSFQLRATVKKVDGKKKLMPESHIAQVRYLSTDKKIATVTAKGKVKAKGAGTCYVYAYAHNGAYKRVKVTVK